MELAPPAERVEVWTLRTDTADAALGDLERLLADSEVDRARRFRFEHLRRDYVLSHGWLRRLCARYLHVDARSLAMTFGSNGKPSLEAGCKLRFNMSHSGGLTVFAFAWELELGVDVERIREIKEIEAIVQRFFCLEEAEEVLAAPEAERARIFHNCWTRKEAFIKATGDGLSMPLDSFRVSLGDGEPARLLHLNSDTEEAGRWTLHNLDVDTHYAGALCYRGSARPIVLKDLNCSSIFKLKV